MDSSTVLKNQLLMERAHAKIYLATDTDCAGTVVVKSKEAEFAKALKMEEDVYNDLLFDAHNVVSCYGNYTSYEDGREIYNVVMEYATEGSLESLMRSGKLIAAKVSGSIDVVDQLRVYSKMILKGLDHIHESGYVHCNLNPTNILAFSPDVDDEADMVARNCYTLKISDLKQSKRVSVGSHGSKRTYWSPFRGNTRYMSPESVFYEEREPPMDIWAFGCIVAEMASAVMTGGLPVREDKEQAARRVLLGGAPEIPQNMCFWGVDFMYRCFHKSPECRWTAKKLLKHPFITGGVSGLFGYMMPMDNRDNEVLKAEDDSWALECFEADFVYEDDDDYDYDGDTVADDDVASTVSSSDT